MEESNDTVRMIIIKKLQDAQTKASMRTILIEAKDPEERKRLTRNEELRYRADCEVMVAIDSDFAENLARVFGADVSLAPTLAAEMESLVAQGVVQKDAHYAAAENGATVQESSVLTAYYSLPE